MAVGWLMLACAGAAVLAGAAHAAPARVVSLNLCTDEYLLLTARPGQIASISRLGGDAQESPLASRARGLITNNGRIGDVLAQQPGLVLTMGRDPQAAALAARLGLRLVALPFPRSPADVAAQVSRVAALVGNAPAGAAFARRVARLAATAPPARPGLMIGGGGLAPAQDGLAAAWLRLAGVAQMRGGTAGLEELLAAPPPILIRSIYRRGQVSGPQAWSLHPALARLPRSVRRIDADGRAFLCGGGAMPAEIMRLRAALAA